MAQPSTIYKPGKLNYVWNYLGKTLKDFAAALSTYLLGGSVDANGNSVINRTSSNTVAIPTGVVATDFTQLIPNFSGMLIVNDHFDGSVELWIAGGGDTVSIGGTNTGGGPVTSTLEIDSTGYLWTNVSGMTGPFTFTVIATRNEA